MKKILITKDVNYGASIGSTNANTAVTPDMLRDGALGIYGIDPSSTNNANVIALITDGGSDVAGKIPAASYKGSQLFFYVGTPTGPVKVLPVQANKLTIRSAKYQAPVKGITYIGWNGTEGGLGLGIILERDEAEIASIENLEQSRTAHVVSISSTLKAGDSAFTILGKMINSYKKTVEIDQWKDRHLLEIVSNGTFSGLGQNLTVVKGSRNATFAATVTVSTGAFIRISGVTYQVTTGVTAGTAIVLDKPYAGESATVLAANVGTLASITEWGLKITNLENYKIFEFAVRGVLENATITYAVAVQPGSGAPDQILAIEKDSRAYRGIVDQIISYMPMIKLNTDPSTNYDMYNITANNSLELKDQTDEAFTSKVEFSVVFPTGVADTGGKNQSDFEDIITTFYPNLVSLF